MANFQSILDCFIPNFKLKREGLENIKTDCVSTVVFNLHQIKRRAFFMGRPVKLPANKYIKSCWQNHEEVYAFSLESERSLKGSEIDNIRT